MYFAGSEIVFFGALLVLVSIVVSTVANRIGAPLLLVFLALGMLVGADSPVGVRFDDFNVAYLVGSLALAVILFDGGLRTTRHSFEIAAWPALILAVPGVMITAAIAGAVAAWLLRYDITTGFLVGAIIAPTDAAAVLLLLRAGGSELRRRTGAVLEIESGLNDPMAIFLTFAAIQVILLGQTQPGHMLVLFLGQMLGGVAIGVAAGITLLWLINRIEIAGGLYPVLACAAALAVFGGAQTLGTSGFLAVYIAGFVVGNRRHRAAKSITRFHDGLAWLSQIGMFLMLGLLVTPHRLLAYLPAAVGIAAALILVARPIAVGLCLAPFRFALAEIGYISWVGLRGAVPIFLASVAVLSGVPHANVLFDVAFVVVLTSLIAQGWTVRGAARLLNLVVPSVSDETERLELDALVGMDRDITAYRVAAGSPATEEPYSKLALPRRTRVIAIVRQGALMNRENLSALEADDYVLAIAPPEQLYALDTMFAAPAKRGWIAADQPIFGEFSLQPDAPVSAIADLYGFPVSTEEWRLTVDAFLAARLPAHPEVGDRVSIAPVEFIVREMRGNRIVRVGIEVAPSRLRFSLSALLGSFRKQRAGPGQVGKPRDER